MEVLYQLNRGWTGTEDFVQLLRRLKRELRIEISSFNPADLHCSHSTRNCLKTLFMMIPYCRDNVHGKGERDVSYRMIYAFYQVFPILAIKAVHLLFAPTLLGSWSDIKYFCVFIERNSPWGADDPLISIVASIANRQLSYDLSTFYIENAQRVSKWIPRECHHSDLFSVFARDFMKISPQNVLSSVKKGLYRKRISGVCLAPSVPRGSSMPSLFMGKYVREAIRLIRHGISGEKVEAIERKWRRLLATFPHSVHIENAQSNPGFGNPSLCDSPILDENGCKKHGLPIIDLDIHISDDILFHSIGFACLIAEKMGLKRILLAGVVPIWVDISHCQGFVGMIQLLMSYCDGRGVSRLEDAIHLVRKGFQYIFESHLLVFVFSEKFEFDWRSLILCNKCTCVFWDMGLVFKIPDDFYISSDEHADFVYMSGYSAGLLMPFFSDDFYVYGFYKRILEKYTHWSGYFDSFISNITMPSGTMPSEMKEILETPNSPSLEPI